jgi:hypothetical protein
MNDKIYCEQTANGYRFKGDYTEEEQNIVKSLIEQVKGIEKPDIDYWRPGFNAYDTIVKDDQFDWEEYHVAIEKSWDEMKVTIYEVSTLSGEERVGDVFTLTINTYHDENDWARSRDICFEPQPYDWIDNIKYIIQLMEKDGRFGKSSIYLF